MILGAGAVGQCVIPLIIEHISNPEHLLIVDMVDNRHRLKSALEKGAVYLQFKVTPENISSFLLDHLKAGDFLLDVA